MKVDPSQEKLVELAKALLDRTKSGTAKWKADDSLNSFSVVTRKGSVVIGTRDDDGQPRHLDHHAHRRQREVRAIAIIIRTRWNQLDRVAAKHD